MSNADDGDAVARGRSWLRRAARFRSAAGSGAAPPPPAAVGGAKTAKTKKKAKATPPQQRGGPVSMGTTGNPFVSPAPPPRGSSPRPQPPSHASPLEYRVDGRVAGPAKPAGAKAKAKAKAKKKKAAAAPAPAGEAAARAQEALGVLEAAQGVMEELLGTVAQRETAAAEARAQADLREQEKWGLLMKTSALQERARRLEQERDAYRRSLDELQRALAPPDAANGDGEAGWNGMRIQVEEMQGALAALEATVQSRDRELETQRETMLVLKASAARTEAEAEAAVRAAVTEAHEHRMETDVLQKELQQARAAEEAVDWARGSSGAAEEAAREHQREAEALRARLDASLEQLADAKQAKEHYEEELTKALIAREMEAADSARKEQARRAKLDISGHHLATLDKKVDAQGAALAKAGEEKRVLESRLFVLGREAAELQRQLDAAVATANGEAADRADAVARCRALEADRDQLRVRADAQDSAIVKLKEYQDDVEDRLRELMGAVGVPRSEVEALQAQLDREKATSVQAREELEVRKQQASALKDQLQEVTASIEAMMAAKMRASQSLDHPEVLILRGEEAGEADEAGEEGAAPGGGAGASVYLSSRSLSEMELAAAGAAADLTIEQAARASKTAWLQKAAAPWARA